MGVCTDFIPFAHRKAVNIGFNPLIFGARECNSRASNADRLGKVPIVGNLPRRQKALVNGTADKLPRHGLFFRIDRETDALPAIDHFKNTRYRRLDVFFGWGERTK